MTFAFASLLLAAAAVEYANAAPAPVLPRQADTQPCWTTYISLPGDTCETVAMAFRIPPMDVLDANSYLNCNDIWPGTPLCIYGKTQVTVTVPPVASTTVAGSGTCWNNYRSQPGDTCQRIAQRFGITPEAVYNANTFLNCDDIWDGTPITICDGNRTRTTVVNSTTGLITSGVISSGYSATPTYVTVTSTSRPGPVISSGYSSVPTSRTVSTTSRPGPIISSGYSSAPTTTIRPPTITPTTIRPSSTPTGTSTVCWTTYQTLPNETCDTIAMAFRIPPMDVINANPSLDCDHIPVGTNVCIYGQTQVTVTVPPATPTTVAGSGTCWSNYRSQPGDTCERIAQRFGITPEAVYNANTFLNCDDIWDGTPIVICDGNRTRTTVVNTTRPVTVF